MCSVSSLHSLALLLPSVCPRAVLEAKYEIPDIPVVNVTHAEVRLRSVF